MIFWPYLTSCEVAEGKCRGFTFIFARKFSKMILGQINELIMRNSWSETHDTMSTYFSLELLKTKTYMQYKSI